MSQSLFDLTGKYLEVKQLSESGVDEQIIIDTLESIDDEIETKADGYTNVIKHLEADNEMIDTEIQRLQKFKKTKQNTVKRMKDNLKESMQTTGKTKFKTALNQFYIKKNPASLVIEHEDNIPKDYYRVEHKLDRTKLKNYLKENEDEHLNGVGLTTSESVVIK